MIFSIGAVENIMESIHITSKGQMMAILENFYIFWETKLSNQINDRLTAKPNIFSVPQYAMTPAEGSPIPTVRSHTTIYSVVHSSQHQPFR